MILGQVRGYEGRVHTMATLHASVSENTNESQTYHGFLPYNQRLLTTWKVSHHSDPRSHSTEVRSERINIFLFSPSFSFCCLPHCQNVGCKFLRTITSLSCEVIHSRNQCVLMVQLLGKTGDA